MRATDPQDDIVLDSTLKKLLTWKKSIEIKYTHVAVVGPIIIVQDLIELGAESSKGLTA